jgi:glycosyltransferase involved in cell wall biosynthesis
MVTEYIFVLDGCTDRSESVLMEMLPQIPHNAHHKIIYANNVFELRANNLGLKCCSNPFAVIVQDDMVLIESNWNERLLLPFQQYEDIWAITARTSCSLNSAGFWEHMHEGPVGAQYSSTSNYPRDICFIGQVVNRGPLMVKMDIMKKIGFFDEHLPGVIGCDDVELCLRVFQVFRLRCGSFWVGYKSNFEWGSTRIGPAASYCTQQERLNMKEVIRRYKHVLDCWKWDETRPIKV